MSQKLFHVGIKAVIVKDDAVLFLFGSWKGTQYWDMAGGKIDSDETAVETTLRRELNEELPGITDVVIGDVIYAGPREFDYPDGNGLFLVFYKVQADLTHVGLSEEHTRMRWVKIEELPSLQEDPNVQCSQLFIEATKRALQKS